MTENRDKLISELQKLMRLDGVKRSKMGLVFEIYDTLVDLRNSGVKAGDIEVLLNDPEGVFNFKLPKGSLTSYMHRIKLKKAASRVERRVAVAAVEPAVPPKLPKPRKPRKSKALGLLDGETPGKPENSPDETGKNSNRPPRLLSEDKGVWGQLKPSPVDGTVDLKQK